MPEIRKKIKSDRVTVYSQTVTLQEITDKVLINPAKLYQNLKNKVIGRISWTVISEEMKTRSSDDLRHFWTRSLLPTLFPNQDAWTQADDLKLLRFIVAQDLTGNVNEVTVSHSCDQINFSEFLKSLQKRQLEQESTDNSYLSFKTAD